MSTQVRVYFWLNKAGCTTSLGEKKKKSQIPEIREKNQIKARKKNTENERDEIQHSRTCQILKALR